MCFKCVHDERVNSSSYVKYMFLSKEDFTMKVSAFSYILVTVIVNGIVSSHMSSLRSVTRTALAQNKQQTVNQTVSQCCRCQCTDIRDRDRVEL